MDKYIDFIAKGDDFPKRDVIWQIWQFKFRYFGIKFV